MSHLIAAKVIALQYSTLHSRRNLSGNSFCIVAGPPQTWHIIKGDQFMRRFIRSIALRYGVAVAVAALALFFTTQYAVMLGRSMFLLFTAAVMLSAVYGGFGPGV